MPLILNFFHLILYFNYPRDVCILSLFSLNQISVHFFFKIPYLIVLQPDHSTCTGPRGEIENADMSIRALCLSPHSPVWWVFLSDCLVSVGPLRIWPQLTALFMSVVFADFHHEQGTFSVGEMMPCSVARALESSQGQAGFSCFSFPRHLPTSPSLFSDLKGLGFVFCYWFIFFSGWGLLLFCSFYFCFVF